MEENESSYPSQLAEMLFTARLKDFNDNSDPKTLATKLISFRFHFTRWSLGEDFIQRVITALEELPLIILQMMHQHQIYLELDLVFEIAAVMDFERKRLLLNKFFLLDETLIRTEESDTFPYGLKGILLHEFCHYIDWYMISDKKLSSHTVFAQAFKQDLKAIPKHLKLSPEERPELCLKHGGILKLSPKDREKMDVSLFILEEEETFSDIFVYLLLGKTRPAIATYFQQSILAAEHLLINNFNHIKA